jgi:D-beta-D-heptose 7-phosphate kinase/D-beta-D-heptose 1-phosphate adenosyltransferase
MRSEGERVARSNTLDPAALEAIVEGWGGLRVLVVGDVLLDEYRIGDVERVSPEAPVPIVRVRRETTALGGAGNVARNVVSLGARAGLVGLLGGDPEAAAVRSLAAQVGIEQGGLIESAGRPTSHKLRVVGRAQQLVRLDRESVEPISTVETRLLEDAIAARLDDCDGVVLADYDKGLFAGGLARFTIELARERGLRVAADPKTDLRRFRGASLVKPNLDEALRFLAPPDRESPRPPVDLEARRSLLEKLQDELGGGEVVVTRGAAGISGLGASRDFCEVPTRRLEVFDVQGAGDTAMASLALARLAGASLVEACIVANAAAAVVVDKVGTAAAVPGELRERLPEIIDLWEREGSRYPGSPASMDVARGTRDS